MEKPVTSVLMPAYNAEDTIRRAVESALAQTEPALELFVVDDGSRIPAAEALAGIDDERLRIIRLPKNGGIGAARNAALREVRSPFVSQLDADDQWEPDYLESILPSFHDPAIGLAYSNTHIEGHPTGHDDYIGDASIHPMDTFPKFAEACPVPCLTATMRTGAVRGVGGYSEWLKAAADYDLAARLVAAGWRFAYVDRQLARYTWPNKPTAQSYHAERVQREVLKMWMAFALRHPLTPGPRKQVRLGLKRELSRLGR